VKRRLMKTYVRCILVTYGCETWVINKAYIPLETVEMWRWRRMERMSWRERRTNEKVPLEINEV